MTEEFSEYNSSDESEPDDDHPDENSDNENNPDEIASDFFHPMIFQDDVLKVSDGIESANDANKKMMNVIESKLLTLNYEKTNYVVLGDKKARKKLLEDLKKDPLLINGQIMKQSPCSKYLGSYLSVNLSESVSNTVKKRIGLANRLTYEIRSIIDDKRAESIGAITTAFLIWESAVISMLLHNSEVFIGMSSKTLKELDKCQLRFLRVTLAVGTGCPIPQLYAQTGTMMMANRILLRKILFLWHVASLGSDTLARQSYKREVRQDHDTLSLFSECKPYLAQFGVSDLRSYSKFQFKRLIKHHIFQKNKKEIIEMSERYKKIDTEKLSTESFEMQSYFKTLNLAQSRLKFKLISKICPTIGSCFHQNPKYKKIGYLCVGCSVKQSGESVSDQVTESSSEELNKSIDTSAHIERCSAYADLRMNLDLRDQRDLLTYVQAVINRRTREEGPP